MKSQEFQCSAECYLHVVHETTLQSNDIHRIMLYLNISVQAQLAQCQAEASVLGQQLHAQTTQIQELDHRGDIQQQLQKAHEEMVGFRWKICTSIMYNYES